MISAGMGSKNAEAIKNELKANICGQGWVDAQQSQEGKDFVQNMGVVDTTCEQNFETAWNTNTKGMNEAQAEFFASNVAYYVGSQLDNTCQNNAAFAYMPTSDPAAAATSLFNKSKCFANYVNPAALPFNGYIAGLETDHSLDEFELVLNYHGEKYTFVEMLPHIRLSAMGMHVGTPEGIDMPQSLKDFIDELEKAGLPKHAQLAHDLFYQGIGLTKPTGEMALAAQPIADQVQEDVKKKAGTDLLDYVGADEGDKAGVAQANAAKSFPDLEYVFVTKTGPKPDYKIDIKEAPKAIKDYFKDFPLPIRREALRLYGEALEKAGKGADEEEVAKLLVKKIKEKDKGDKAKLADELMRLKVDQVPMKGKMPTNIIFKEISSPNAPYDLLERVGWEGSHAKVYAINRIWRDVVEKVGEDKMNLKLMGQIVDDLAPQLKGKSIKDLAAQKVVSVNTKTGKVTLLEYPKEIQDTLFHTANAVNNNLPPNMAQHGAAVYHKVVEIYEAAKKAKPSMKDEVVAAKVEDVADKKLNPFLNNDPYHPDPVGKFLLSEFSHFDEDGNIVLKDKYPSKGNADGSWTAKTDSGWDVVFNAGVIANGGLVLGVDGKDKDPAAKEGSEILTGFVLGAMKLGFGKEDVGNFTINAGLMGFASPPLMTPGIPEQEQNVSTSLGDGSGQIFRLNHLYLMYDRSWDNEKTDVDLAFKGGLIGVRPGDGSELGVTFMSTPFSAFQPFTQKSSQAAGGAGELGLAWGEIDTHYNDESHNAKLTMGVVLGSALTAFYADEKGGSIDAAGFRWGGFLQGDFDASSAFESTDLKFRLLGVGYQHSSGEYDGVKDALSGYSLLFGGSMMVQPHEHFQAGLGGSYGFKKDELDGKIQRFVIGGYLAAPVEIEGKDVTVIPNVGLAVNKIWTDERKTGEGTTDGTPDEPCPSGYVCEGGGGATIGDDSQGGLGTGDMPFIMAGNTFVELNPNVEVKFGKTGLFLGGGLDILIIKNVQTGEMDTVLVPSINFGGEW